MAYFLPSYFQKRLLRYALSRFDFIETDNLDLENLGISWGQRSVIELKDVGIQITKLAALLNILPSILVTHARIGLLRLTIPADLYASGIEVEVGGIDVQVRLQDNGAQRVPYPAQPRSSSGLSRGSRADRPRIGFSAVHDPGGTRHSRLKQSTVGDTMIPTSHNLALSFLETEPPEERRELQSIVQSQSQYLQRSSPNAPGDGTGAPGGFELPTFVANFFKGVVDRLSLSIKDVSCTVVVSLPRLGTASVDTIKIVLQVSEIELQGLRFGENGLETSESRRSFTAKNVELLLLSEPGLVSQVPQSSTNSSPRLSRAHTKLSSGSSNSISNTTPTRRFPLSKSGNSQHDPENCSALSQQSSESSDSSRPAFSSDLQSGIAQFPDTEYGQQSMEESSVAFSTGVPSGRSASGSLANTGSVDNQGNAEFLARRGEPQSSEAHTYAYMEQPQDLAESKVFSHDEAESMYMSAMSHDMQRSHPHKAMPGAWDWSEHEEQTPIASMSSKVEPKSTLGPSASKHDLATAPHRTESQFSDLHDSESSKQDATLAKQPLGYERGARNPELFDVLFVAKRVLSISAVTVLIARKGNSRDETVEPVQQNSQKQRRGSSTHTQSTSFADESTYSLFPGQMFASNLHVPGRHAAPEKAQLFDHAVAQARQSTGPVVKLGTISVALDLPIGKLFVRVWQELKSMTELLGAGDNIKSAESEPSPLDVEVQHVNLNVCEEVAELVHEHGTYATLARETCNNDDDLLQISLSKTNFCISFDGTSTLQRLTVTKILVSHKSKPIMLFADPPNMRTSMNSSVLPVGADLVISTQTSEILSQTDVQLRYIKLKLDLLQIDDVLSRSGGLSSLLDLGSSILSPSTIRGDSAKVKDPLPYRRSVRFERLSTPQPQEDLDNGPGHGKVNVRVAGVFVQLIGSDSTLHVKTSAVKLVYRQNLLGLQIDWTEVDGPLTKEQTQSDIKLKINNVRLEYLNSPEEEDLERLLAILAPSSDKHEVEKDDDIMVGTLIRQRRKGGVLRIKLLSLETTVYGFKWQRHLARLSDELSRLSSVSKYLPEDDRPGMLTLALIRKIEVKLVSDPGVGTFSLTADLAEGAHVNVPSLMAAHITTLQVLRDKDHVIGDVVSSADPKLAMSPPMLMGRFIADEMEPTIRVKLFNLMLEYKISTVAALIELGNAVQSAVDDSRPFSPTSSITSSNAAIRGSRDKTRISLAIRDSAVGLSPLHSPAKIMMLLSDTVLTYTAGKDGQTEASADLRKLSMLVCDDCSRRTTSPKNADSKMFFDESLQVQEFVTAGFVPTAFLSAASVVVYLLSQKPEREITTNIELNNGLLILETCADSTQTMMQVLNDLSPPAIPSKTEKYRTEIVPIQDMLASFTGNAYFTEPEQEVDLPVMPCDEEVIDEVAVGEDLPGLDSEYIDGTEEAEETSDFTGQLWQSQSEAEAPDLSESYYDSELAQSKVSASPAIPPVNAVEDAMGASHEDVMVHSMLDFQEDHFSRNEAVGGTAHRWDLKQNTYGLGSDTLIRQAPLKVKVRDLHVIWHLFDGYDWQATRDSISKAVHDVEIRAASRRPRSSSRLSPRPEEEDESEIGDFLFNSIYIGIPANKDPKELTSAINREIDDMTSETGSYATTTTVTASPTRRPSGTRQRHKKLRLERGKHHKMAFELKGISVDFISFPPGSGEVESSVDIRVQDLEIIDQLPTSTWKKFATYMRDAGEREVDTNMVHIEMLNVKPIADLAASEISLKITVLPLRLHVDQDAIDFMSRFFEFKDDRVPASTTPSTPPFLQRVEVNPIRLKLDFKPKRVDYSGLRSGRTTEFMNFFVLDRADMVLRRVILYGVSGFDRMGIMLNNIWSPDVRRNQLPGVLAGLAPIRSLVDVGSGVRDLVVVPMREYKKDGRIVRSIQKGALAFAKTTSKELVNLGAKLAIGTQTVLQDTEKMLGQAKEQERWDDQGEDEEKRQISLYADQPIGIVQGLHSAYASLERDLLLAKDAIVAVPGEVMATDSATGAAQAVLKSAPTIILRPAIAASKAIGQTLLGAGNTLDRENYRRMEEKYKRH